MRCAATTTILEVLKLNGYPDEDTQPCPVAALAALELLVEAAQNALDVLSAAEAGERDPDDAVNRAAKHLSAALAAVGPGEETAG